jgi:hypothetical protein
VVQINIRIDKDIDEIISYLAEKRMVAKSKIARELLIKGLVNDMLPLLIKDYQEGRISIKKIISLTKLPPLEVFKKIAVAIDEPPISPEVDDYTAHIADEILKQWDHEIPP